MIRITHPRPDLGRQQKLGVEFRDGVATVEELHPERERALLQHGFTIERESAGFEVPPVAVSASEDPEAVELEAIREPEATSEEGPSKGSKRRGRGKPVEAENAQEAAEQAPAGQDSSLPEHVVDIWNGDYSGVGKADD